MRKSYTLQDAMLLALGAYSLGGRQWMLPEENQVLLVDRWFAAVLNDSAAATEAVLSSMPVSTKHHSHFTIENQPVNNITM